MVWDLRGGREQGTSPKGDSALKITSDHPFIYVSVNPCTHALEAVTMIRISESKIWVPKAGIWFWEVRSLKIWILGGQDLNFRS